MAAYEYTPLGTTEGASKMEYLEQRAQRNRKVGLFLGVTSLITLGTLAVIGHLSHTPKKTSKSSSSTSLAAVGEEGLAMDSSSKVHIEIIAESMCPNCKEHSHLFEEHIMSKGSDLTDVLDIDLKMMVIDGWNSVKDEGECEKGKWDCVLGKYQLAGWHYAEDLATTNSWKYTRCLFKEQPALIEHYVGSPKKLESSFDFMETKITTCAEEAGFTFSEMKTWVQDHGTKKMYDDYQHIKEFDDPVWIKVNGHYVEYEADWLSVICVAAPTSAKIKACEDLQDLEGVNDAAVVSTKETESTGGQSVATKSKELFTADNGKVNVYIVAEAFCPNCKEHSYYMDRLLMTPQGEKSGLRDIMNIYMEQMVLDGWDKIDDTGVCEKGKYDCELSKYNLCSQVLDNSIDNNDKHMWWDFVRCNYKHQEEILEMYKIKKVNAKLISDITTTCAAEAGVDYESISSCASGTMGTELLHGSFKRVSSMSMPVWIYVNGQKIAEHEDWLAAVCAAYTGDNVPTECTGV
jgi:predicted nucleic-acid-binding Zn-ribbon protein